MPNVVVIAGPNGAGKSTLAPYLLRDRFRILEFVNADTIAAGLSAFSPESVAFEAGRVMLNRLSELAFQQEDFAFETTLASRTYERRIRQLQAVGYSVHIVFLWLPSVDLAIERVERRLYSGGNGIPENTIRRRYERGLTNLTRVYLPLAQSWQVFDASGSEPMLIALGDEMGGDSIVDVEKWKLIEK